VSLTAEWKRILQQQFGNLVILDFLNAMAMQRKETDKKEGAEYEYEDDSKEDYGDEFEDDEADEGTHSYLDQGEHGQEF
jgi:hypothetical protein